MVCLEVLKLGSGSRSLFQEGDLVSRSTLLARIGFLSWYQIRFCPQSGANPMTLGDNTHWRQKLCPMAFPYFFYYVLQFAQFIFQFTNPFFCSLKFDKNPNIEFLILVIILCLSLFYRFYFLVKFPIVIYFSNTQIIVL